MQLKGEKLYRVRYLQQASNLLDMDYTVEEIVIPADSIDHAKEQLRSTKFVYAIYAVTQELEIAA